MSNWSKRIPVELSRSLSVCAVVIFITFNLALGAQSQEAPVTSTPAANASLPSVIRFSGKATDSTAKSASGLTGVTFALYEQETGGPALWLETQNVPLDATGHFSALLGATKPEGLPAEIFFSGQARWIGVQVSGQPEQPRVMLLTVPYAMKAGDAATVGGLPPSAFMLATHAAPSATVTNTITPGSATPVASLTGTGTANFVPLWTSSSALANSVLFQTGTGSTAKIGIGNTAPSATLDVSGAATIRGLLNLPNSANATAAAGAISRPLGLVASTFNSSTSTASNQVFHWQAEPVGNNTATPSATLNLLFATAPAAAAETGLKINSKGVITFASGQTFPGGSGTITGVTAGTGLTGGGTSGVVTLNLDSSKVPELGTSNNFTAPQQFQGNAGFGTTPSGNGYIPLSVGSASSFGTWLSLGNSSAGGHTWNIISAASENAEGAGNFGITDLTGKSTIWLEGNTNTANLTATGSAGGAIIDADVQGKNNGANTPGLRFGGAASGEGIASNRVAGENGFGLQLFTEFIPRISILQSGKVAVGITNPNEQLDVWATSSAYDALASYGGNATNGSGAYGSNALYGLGGNGDLTSTSSVGGSGILAEGGMGGLQDGAGGIFYGGNHSTYGDGILAYSGSANSWAGFFTGNVGITGITAGVASAFRIDHPLDPANKYLSHSAVQSPDMLNIYNGNVVTDANGDAVVVLPEWFETLNRDFRYQLTVIGQFAQAIIGREVANHQFTIKTDKPGVKVSWLVTGIRQDAWANAHRIPVEEQKSAIERGHYLNPELYGAGEEAGIQSARHPQVMKKLRKMRAQAALTGNAQLSSVSGKSR